MNPITGLSPLDGAVLDSIPEPVIVVDRRRDVVAANAAAGQEFGVFYRGRALALSLRHPLALEAVDKVLAGGVAENIEVNFPAPTARAFSLVVAPLRSEAAPGVSPAGAVLVFHDVTAERRAEQVRSDFVANASHELRSPLSALVGFIETIKGPAHDDPEAQSRFLDIMAVEAQRMTRLVEDLLSLSGIEAHEHVLPQGQIDIVQVVGHVAESLRRQAAQRSMTVRVEAAPGLPQVNGDPDQLDQVFRNLVENAVAYGRPGTEVTVTIRPIDRVALVARPGVAVAVQDRGDGIAKEHLPRLTERFYRIDKARSRKLGGTGLGLAIVKHIVNRHRGRLTIESELGKGSVFTVALPAA